MLEAHKTETERLKQIELAEVKSECQRALADLMRAFQDSLSEKEAQHIAEKDNLRNAGEVERHKAKLLASDKEALQRELLQTQNNMRETVSQTEARFEEMEAKIARQEEAGGKKTSFDKHAVNSDASSARPAQETHNP